MLVKYLWIMEFLFGQGAANTAVVWDSPLYAVITTD